MAFDPIANSFVRDGLEYDPWLNISEVRQVKWVEVLYYHFMQLFELLLFLFGLHHVAQSIDICQSVM
jgi:hypothetical protein